MNAVTALFLGLCAVVFSQQDSISATESGSDSYDVDWDSDDTNSGSDTSYSGIVIRVFQENAESPTIALGTSLDDLENIYCLKFLGFYESEDYNTTVSEDASFSVVTGSEISLDDAQCDVQDVTDETFKIYCMNVNGGYLSLTFQFTRDEEGDYGLEYTVILGDYQWTSQDSAAKLVMVQSVMECSEALSSNSTSTDTNDATTRRLLQDVTEEPDSEEDTDDDVEDTDDDTDNSESEEDDEEGSNSAESNSAEESAGVSSDDSREFDEGNVRFVLNGQAFDQCDVTTNGESDTAVASKLVYQTEAKELHIVFDHFNCDLYQDPRFLIDESKVTGEETQDDSGVVMVNGVMAVLMGCVAAWAL